MEKIHTEFAKDLVKHYELEDDAKELFKDSLKTTDFLDVLMSNELYMDAITLLSHSLPKREAVWWACICAKKHQEEVNDELFSQTIVAAEKWVYDPSEKNRRVAEFYAEKGQYETAAAWVAAAAFWSGDSIMPEGEPVIAPAEYLYSHAVRGCIVTCVGMNEKSAIEDSYQEYLSHGINIANGGNG